MAAWFPRYKALESRIGELLSAFRDFCVIFHRDHVVLAATPFYAIAVAAAGVAWSVGADMFLMIPPLIGGWLFLLIGISLTQWPTHAKRAARILSALAFLGEGSALYYHFHVDTKKETALAATNSIKNDADNFKPFVDALASIQRERDSQNQHIEAIQQILSQYDQLASAIQSLEQLRGANDVKDRLAIADHLRNELSASLQAIEVRSMRVGAGIGSALIIKIAPNTFRFTFSVPMRIAPEIAIPTPPGITANIIEKSNIGFTVVFTPLTTPIDRFP